MRAYYNENEPFAAAWLRELVKAGHLPAGDVDERSIEEVSADDLRPYTACHFFAGIGGWPLALRLAGWPDDRPVWTGSAPCQPFSVAGKRGGRVTEWEQLRIGGAYAGDPRHLWPVFGRLVAQCGPSVVFGEQSASPDGRAWLAAVRADLEAMGYAVGAADLCAAGVGAPHWRQRLYWCGVGDADRARLEGRRAVRHGTDQWHPGSASVAGRMGVADRERRDGEHALLRPEESGRVKGDFPEASGTGGALWLGDASSERVQGQRGSNAGASGEVCGEARKQRVRLDQRASGSARDNGDSAGGWSRVDWIYCRDDKWRPVEPGTFPLADGVPARVGRLRGYGNAVVPEVAATFVQALTGAGWPPCEARHMA